MTKEQIDYVEDMALFFDQLGLTRASGRIFGYMILSPTDHPSPEDFMKDLHMSKGSVSMSLKALQVLGYIEPVSIRGSRKTHYILKQQSFKSLIEQRNKVLGYMIEKFKNGQKLQNKSNPHAIQWLSGSIEFYSWMAEKVLKLAEEWENMKKSEG